MNIDKTVKEINDSLKRFKL